MLILENEHTKLNYACLEFSKESRQNNGLASCNGSGSSDWEVMISGVSCFIEQLTRRRVVTEWLW